MNFGSENPKWVNYIAKDCGHYIFRDDPDFVIQKFLDLYDQVQIKK